MNYFQRFVSAAFILSITSVANSAVITTQLEDVTNGGGFFGEVTFSDSGTDTVNISADISDPINADLTQGDILAIWFDFADFSALSGSPTITNENPSGIVVDSFFGEDSVSSSLGGNLNLEGTGETNWDFAVITGSAGPDFYQTLSFDLTIDGLDANQFSNQRVGMRVQSIPENYFEEGSSKLIGIGRPPVEVPEPGTLGLLGLGIIGLLTARRKAQKKL
ncbi:PEP-CTERM sorting domain-containing protein [Marinobacter sp. HL-58]|uniref:PEP-CTERM sorting domain-containing protein n=1 Tax=Marinobacter sp. HL-58 TaxID=1479237 RepID=UPI0004851876|nr:PEP-CTERM sorting domain-containing protein [Marinobacter sp. HL-58]KPP99228.1 MAG: secreted protein [Marinobacter sp. HL-58]